MHKPCPNCSNKQFLSLLLITNIADHYYYIVYHRRECRIVKSPFEVSWRKIKLRTTTNRENLTLRQIIRNH